MADVCKVYYNYEICMLLNFLQNKCKSAFAFETTHLRLWEMRYQNWLQTYSRALKVACTTTKISWLNALMGLVMKNRYDIQLVIFLFW